ncbi:MAG: DUF4184 family protein [Mariniblastus sp.]
MPFTPTHVLAVLPIGLATRNLMPLSALAIGAMTPDATMFFPLLSPGYQEAHAAYGPILACLPFGLMAFLLFQFVLKEPLIGLCPTAFRNRMAAISQPYVKPSVLFFLLVSVGIVTGAYTHLLWDSFTHRHRFGTELFPQLNQTYIIFGRTIPLFSILQHGSSVVGLPILFISAMFWIQKQPSVNDGLGEVFVATNSTRWLAVGFANLTVCQAFYEFGLDTWHTLEIRASQTVTRSILVLTLAAVIYSVILQFYCLREKRRDRIRRLRPGQPTAPPRRRSE